MFRPNRHFAKLKPLKVSRKDSLNVMLLSAAMFSTIDDSCKNSRSPRIWDRNSYVSRARRFLVRRLEQLRETMGSGKENLIGQAMGILN